MTKFVDPHSVEKPMVIDENENRIEVDSIAELDGEVIIEHSANYKELEKLNEKAEIFLVHTKDMKDERDRLELEKSDHNDCLALKSLYENGYDFAEFDKINSKSKIIKKELAKYKKLIKMGVGLKNQKQDYEREISNDTEFIDEAIKNVEREKEKCRKWALNYLGEEIDAMEIKGLGPSLALKLFGEAHPLNFPVKGAYLAYLGFKGSVGMECNHRAKSVVWEIQSGTMRARDPKFYPLYKKIKEDMRERFPDKESILEHWELDEDEIDGELPYKGSIDNLTRNRVCTLIAKHIWEKYHDGIEKQTNLEGVW